eukprot:6195673-Pleurochrysis_carterae.AAC.4
MASGMLSDMPTTTTRGEARSAARASSTLASTVAKSALPAPTSASRSGGIEKVSTPLTCAASTTGQPRHSVTAPSAQAQGGRSASNYVCRAKEPCCTGLF